MSYVSTLLFWRLYEQPPSNSQGCYEQLLAIHYLSFWHTKAGHVQQKLQGIHVVSGLNSWPHTCAPALSLYLSPIKTC